MPYHSRDMCNLGSGFLKHGVHFVMVSCALPSIPKEQE